MAQIKRRATSKLKYGDNLVQEDGGLLLLE
jgi:hypothetical protein